MTEDGINPPTVQQHAERLLGRHPTCDGKTEPQIKKTVVAELCDIDPSTKSDSFVDAAFRILTTGDPRMAMTRRHMRLEAARRSELQIRHLRTAVPAGMA